MLCLFFPLDVEALIKGEAIRGEVVRHIERSLPWPREDVRMDIEAPPDLAEFSADRAVIRVETVGKEDYLGEMAFRVRVTEGGKQRNVNVRGRLELLRSVVVSAGALASGAIVNPEDVRVKKRWVTRLDPLLLSSPEEVIGRQLTASVRAGDEIKKSVVQNPLLVKRGKIVCINLEKGPLKISTVGISEEDGARGALIRVRNVSSNRMVYARVVGANTVQVDF